MNFPAINQRRDGDTIFMEPGREEGRLNAAAQENVATIPIIATRKKKKKKKPKDDSRPKTLGNCLLLVQLQN